MKRRETHHPAIISTQISNETQIISKIQFLRDSKLIPYKFHRASPEVNEPRAERGLCVPSFREMRSRRRMREKPLIQEFKKPTDKAKERTGMIS
jgi:hypothetical protein